MKLSLSGQPIPQARHRSFYMAKRIINYDPLSVQKDEVRAELNLLLNGLKDAEGSVEARNMVLYDFYYIDLSFYFPVNKTDSKALKNAKLWGFEKHTSSPDLDNLEKFILDTSKSILLSDDRKVVKLPSEKLYSENPRTEITITGFFMDNSKVRKILSLISPSEFKFLTQVCTEIAQLSQDYGDPYLEDSSHAEIAELLSRLADNSLAYLIPINKKFPEYHKEAL